MPLGISLEKFIFSSLADSHIMGYCSLGTLRPGDKCHGHQSNEIIFCSDEHGECRFILEYIMFASCIHDSCVFYVHRMCGTAFHELQLVAVRFLDAEGN